MTIFRLFLFVLIFNIRLCGHSQTTNFKFVFLNEKKISFNNALYKTDTVSIKTPDSNYIDVISNIWDDKIVDREISKYRYVFPLKVQYKDSVYLVTFTPSGLYSLLKDSFSSMTDYRNYLTAILINRDTVKLNKIPTQNVGSANFLCGESYDAEFIFFRQSRWAFINYYFDEDETGLWYDFTGIEPQIPLVVNQLYNWGVLVVDGSGTDQRGTIAIQKKDISTFFRNDDVLLGNGLLYEWRSYFGEKHLFRNTLYNPNL